MNDLYEIDNNLAPDSNENDSIDACDMTNPCDCDWDNSGALHVLDIFAFLNDWFAGCTTAQTPPPCWHSADFNHIGGTNIQDIFDFLSCWFANQC